MKMVVKLGDEIGAKKACERQLRQKYKSIGALKIVTDRRLQVGDLAVIDISATTINKDGSTGQAIPDAESNELLRLLARGFYGVDGGDVLLSLPDLLRRNGVVVVTNVHMTDVEAEKLHRLRLFWRCRANWDFE